MEMTVSIGDPLGFGSDNEQDISFVAFYVVFCFLRVCLCLIGTYFDVRYVLFAVVVHVGSAPSQGHYVTLVRRESRWFRFDDEDVCQISESEVRGVFGCLDSGTNRRDRALDDSRLGSETGYILFYQQVVPLALTM